MIKLCADNKIKTLGRNGSEPGITVKSNQLRWYHQINLQIIDSYLKQGISVRQREYQLYNCVPITVHGFFYLVPCTKPELYPRYTIEERRLYYPTQKSRFSVDVALLPHRPLQACPSPFLGYYYP